MSRVHACDLCLCSGSWLLFTVQGSVVSSLLCNFYYGTMEQEQLPQYLLEQGGPRPSPSASGGANLGRAPRGTGSGDIAIQHVLLRLIDDFMLLSTSLPSSQEFVKVGCGWACRIGVGCVLFLAPCVARCRLFS